MPYLVAKWKAVFKIKRYVNIIQFWIHLENLPENSIAKQFLQILAQLAVNKKQPFAFSVSEILFLYGFPDRDDVHDLKLKRSSDQQFQMFNQHFANSSNESDSV